MKIKTAMTLLLCLLCVKSFAIEDKKDGGDIQNKISQQNVLIKKLQSDIRNVDYKLIQQSKKHKKEIDYLRKLIGNQKKSLNELIGLLNKHKSKFSELNNSLSLIKDGNQEKFDYLIRDLDSLNDTTSKFIDDYDAKHSEITGKIFYVEDKVNVNEKVLSGIDNNINSYINYGVIGALSLLTLLLLSYILLSKRIKLSNKDSMEMINLTRRQLEEEGVKLDHKLVELLENKIQIINHKHNEESESEIDHSLALKVADEIIRIQKNIANMDSSTKGLKQLSASVKRIQDNFLSNGYELVDMLGKEYQEGMNAIANFITSDQIASGQQIISRIIKPQVNFKGVMIQAAQIEVTIGE